MACGSWIATEKFTFHNVSINTVNALGITRALQINLHSTMFLLIRIEDSLLRLLR